MTFTRNKLDKYNETLLNKLVEFGGDITYMCGIFIWMGLHFQDSGEMKELLENKK